MTFDRTSVYSITVSGRLTELLSLVAAKYGVTVEEYAERALWRSLDLVAAHERGKQDAN